MSPITRGWAWECVECHVTSMVTFPEPLLPGQQLRPADPREEEGEGSRKEEKMGEKTERNQEGEMEEDSGEGNGDWNILVEKLDELREEKGRRKVRVRGR